MSDLAKFSGYAEFLGSLKERIRQAQVRAAVSVNRELMRTIRFGAPDRNAPHRPVRPRTDEFQALAAAAALGLRAAGFERPLLFVSAALGENDAPMETPKYFLWVHLWC